MSALPKEAIIEYQRIYQKVYGKKISLAKAAELSQRLLNLVMIIETPNEYENEKLHSNPQRTT